MWQRRYEAFIWLRHDADLINVRSKEPHPNEWMAQNTAELELFVLR